MHNAATAQIAGALDDLYPAAASVNDLGVKVAGGDAAFKLWAPTAQKVSVGIDDVGIALASDLIPATFGPAIGVWSVTQSADLLGKDYRDVVEVSVRGAGLVRNRVTDPYSISLTADSKRNDIADLSSAALKPAGWDASIAQAKVAAQTDMVIYGLHVRDFSANDFSVSAVNRGKYLAFAESGSAGMTHLKALAADTQPRGLTGFSPITAAADVLA